MWKFFILYTIYFLLFEGKLINNKSIFILYFYWATYLLKVTTKTIFICFEKDRNSPASIVLSTLSFNSLNTSLTISNSLSLSASKNSFKFFFLHCYYLNHLTFWFYHHSIYFLVHSYCHKLLSVCGLTNQYKINQCGITNINTY